jgi:hypothetical protein
LNFEGLRKESLIIRLAFTLALLLIVFVSCRRAQNCTPVSRDFVIIQFVDSLGVPKNEILTITSAASDSILVTANQITTQFNLPLDPFRDNVTYLVTQSGIENWITLGYRNAVFINSDECGPEFVFSDLAIWGTSYDSVRLVNTRILEGIDVNVRIYDY